MARSKDPDSAGSQFFICHGDAALSGPAVHRLWQIAIKGDDVLEKIGHHAHAAQRRRREKPPEETDGVESIKIVPAA